MEDKEHVDEDERTDVKGCVDDSERSVCDNYSGQLIHLPSLLPLRKELEDSCSVRK